VIPSVSASLKSKYLPFGDFFLLLHTAKTGKNGHGASTSKQDFHPSFVSKSQ